MDRNPSPSKGPRIYNESEPADEQKCSNLQTRLCNELVYEVCKEIPLIGTADDILLTALNIRTYLAKRFRKKLIFCEAVAFIKAWLNKERKGVVIQIDRVAQSNESEHVLRQQQQLDNVFELRTDYFRIRIETNKSLDENDVRFVDEDQFGNAHVQYFLRLIVPLLQPIELRLTGLTVIQSKLSGHLVHLRAKYFLSPNISAALADYNHLAIYQSSLGSDKFPQFIRTFIRWLNVNGKSKSCTLYFINKQMLALLLEELKADFSRATTGKTFTVRMRVRHQTDAEEPPFTMSNGVGEQLKFRRRISSFLGGYFRYTLKRRPIEHCIVIGGHPPTIQSISMPHTDQ